MWIIWIVSTAILSVTIIGLSVTASDGWMEFGSDLIKKLE